MSQEVSDAIEVLGNRSRATIVHLLACRAPRSATELAVELNSPREAIYIHMRLLERSGVIVRAVYPGGAPNVTYWEVDPRRVDALIQLWADFMAGRRGR